MCNAHLVVLEQEERLHEGEEQVHDVDQDVDVAVARLQARVLEVRGDMQAVQGHAAERERCNMG